MPEAQEAGVECGPTRSGKRYLSYYEHRGANRRKSCWAVSVEEEFAIFAFSDDQDLQDDDGHFWGRRDEAGAVLGTKGERLAKFPFNAVETVPWHGFPVSPASGRASEVPPDDLVERMIEDGFVSRTFGRKLQRRRA